MIVPLSPSGERVGVRGPEAQRYDPLATGLPALSQPKIPSGITKTLV